MPNRTTTALILLFFASLIGLWLAEWASLPTSDQRERLSGRVLPTLLNLPAEAIRRVEIHGGDSSLVFQRSGKGWIMLQPVSSPADRSRIESLLQSLKALPRPLEGAEALTGDPARYGLAPPSRTIRVYSESSQRPIASLEVGDTVREARYVRPEGRSEIEVVDPLALAGIDDPPHAWRDRSLFDRSSFEIGGIEVRDGGDQVLLAARKDSRGWRLTAPISAPGETNQVEGLVGDLLGLLAAEGDRGFIADHVSDFTPFGLEPPVRRIILSGPQPGDPAEIVHIGSPVPDHPGFVHARRGDSEWVLAIPASALSLLERDAYDFRSRRAIDVRQERVTELKIRAGEVEHSLVRTPQGWHVNAPVGGPADETTVTSLVGELARLEVLDLIDPTNLAGTGLEEPLTVIAVAEGAEVQQLSLGRRDQDADRRLALSEGDTAVLSLRSDALDHPFDEPLAFLNRQLLRDPVGRLRRIQVDREGRSFELEAEETNGRAAVWKLTQPIASPADRETASLLAALLANLRAARLIAQGTADAERFGLNKPWATVRWTIAPSAAGSEPIERALTIGGLVDTEEGGRYATLEGSPQVFSIDPNPLAILNAEPRNRLVLDFPPEQVEQIELRREGRSTTYGRTSRPFGNGHEWKREGEAALEPADIDGFLTALSSLRAERFIQDEGKFPEEAGLDESALAIAITLRGDLGTRTVRFGRSGPDRTRFATVESGESGAVFHVNDTGEEPWSTLLIELPDEPFVRDRTTTP